MTTPVVANTATFADAASTSHAVTLPTGTAVGDLLLVFLTVNATTFSTPAGWTQLYQSANGTANAACFYRKADGSEGSTLTVATVGSQKVAANSYDIAGWSGIPAFSTAATGSSNNTQSASLTIPWGASTNLFLSIAHQQTTSTTPTYPSGYSGGIFASTSGTSSSVTASAWIASASATESPGAFTMGNSAVWVAYTVGIQSTFAPLSFIAPMIGM